MSPHFSFLSWERKKKKRKKCKIYLKITSSPSRPRSSPHSLVHKTLYEYYTTSMYILVLVYYIFYLSGVSRLRRPSIYLLVSTLFRPSVDFASCFKYSRNCFYFLVLFSTRGYLQSIAVWHVKSNGPCKRCEYFFSLVENAWTPIIILREQGIRRTTRHSLVIIIT